MTEYRYDIDFSEYVDEMVEKVQHRVDQAVLDKAADTLAEYGYVKVVRCRDCKHLYIPQWDEILAAEYGAPPIVCERTGDMDDVEPDGFCAWAERKEGGE